MNHPFLVLVLACLPFIAKSSPFSTALFGFIVQKALQLLIPVYWNVSVHKLRGIKALWPVESSFPDQSLICIAVISGLLFGCAGMLGIHLIPWLFSLPAEEIRAGVDINFSGGSIGALAVVLAVTFFNSPLEEYFYRVWLDRELSHHWNDAKGITLSSIYFSFVHVMILGIVFPFPQYILCIVFLLVLIPSVFWSKMMRKPGGIYASIISHTITTGILLTSGLFWLGYY